MSHPPTPPDSPASKSRKVHESSSPSQSARSSLHFWGQPPSSALPLQSSVHTSQPPVVRRSSVDLSEDEESAQRHAVVTPPASPVSKASQEKLAAGTKQYVTLLNAIRESTLCTTHGGDWKNRKVKSGGALTFLQGMVEKQRHVASERSAFRYLFNHTFGSTTEDQVRELVVKLDAKYGQCVILPGSGYPQVKIPCSTQTVTPGDKKANKHIGLIQVQSYNLAEIIHKCTTDQELMLSLEAEIKAVTEQHYVSAHVCKKVCLNINHTLKLTDNVNIKFHDACAAMWVINGVLYSFCHCSSKGIRLAPSSMFSDHDCVARFKANLGALGTNTTNVNV